MKQYAILIGDEDGNCIKFLKPGEENNLESVMEDYGIKEFVVSHGDPYPENWDAERAVLIEYEVKVPFPVEIVTKLKI